MTTGAEISAETRGRGRLDEAQLTQLGSDIQRRIGVKTSRNDPLARFTTMRVGGPADLFAEVHNLFELRGLVRFARSRGLPYFVIGRGSDLVISDAGMRGLVIHNRAQQHRFEGNLLTADSGVPMARAATVAKGEGLSGLEFGLAVPASSLTMKFACLWLTDAPPTRRPFMPSPSISSPADGPSAGLRKTLPADGIPSG